MKAATLRDELVGALHELAWNQWSQLGVSGPTPRHREERAADPEALLLFTLNVARSEPRLFDEVLDWLALNEPLISVHRLRNICAGDADRALVDAALAWVARTRRRERPEASRSAAMSTGELESLFPSLPTPTGGRDPAFSRYGLARTPLEPSGKSQRPRFDQPISFALRLRRLLGVGVRAEVVRTLLTIRARRISGGVITASAAFAQRNVREGLAQLHDAGVTTVIEVSGDRYYTINHEDWAKLLQLGSASELPFHHDWIPGFRALTSLAHWLERPGLDDLSDYLLASQARTLVTEIEPDLRYVGIPLGAYNARGADFWREFVEIVRAAVRSAMGPQ
jgi:hypothetical protein